jgi:hypothetical protein
MTSNLAVSDFLVTNKLYNFNTTKQFSDEDQTWFRGLVKGLERWLLVFVLPDWNVCVWFVKLKHQRKDQTTTCLAHLLPTRTCTTLPLVNLAQYKSRTSKDSIVFVSAAGLI